MQIQMITKVLTVLPYGFKSLVSSFFGKFGLCKCVLCAPSVQRYQGTRTQGLPNGLVCIYMCTEPGVPLAFPAFLNGFYQILPIKGWGGSRQCPAEQFSLRKGSGRRKPRMLSPRGGICPTKAVRRGVGGSYPSPRSHN